MLTTKKLPLKAIVHELLWFLDGDTNIKYLRDNGVSIWDEWADANGDLGPVYGSQWRSWPAPDGRSIDQISNVIDMIRRNPDSRRLIVSAWNPADVDKMALPPCHCLFQFYVANGKLSCQLYQRSADVFLGVPFNIASYALLTMMVAQVTGLKPGDFVHSLGDAHLYSNHLEQARLQLTRPTRRVPVMKINPEVKDIFASAMRTSCSKATTRIRISRPRSRYESRCERLMSLTIRRARSDEAGLVLSLCSRTGRIRKAAARSRGHRSDDRCCAVRRVIRGCSARSPNGRVEPVGFAVWFVNFSTFSGRSGIYLEDLFVRPALRGKGIGKALLVHLAKECVANSWSRLQWSVLDWNTPSIEFYKSLGAVLMDEWTMCQVGGPALTALAQATR